MTIIDKLKTQSITVATISDNVANVQKAGRLSAGLDLNCHAHVANLLLKDLADVFALQFEQVIFFHGHHRPPTLYKEYMKDGKFSHVYQITTTRWGTQTDSLQSVRRNREIIEKILRPLD